MGGRRTRSAIARSITYSPRRQGLDGSSPGADRRRLTVLEEDRPRFRFECEPAAGGVRPCPWVSCRYNLAIDVGPEGSLKVNFPDAEGWVDFDAMPDTCALDVATHGGRNLERVGERMNLTRERARQVEDAALRKVRRDAGPELLELLEASAPMPGRAEA